MGKVFKFLFDRLVDPLGLPIEAWKEYLILFAIGGIAYIIAFFVVGRMYACKDISTKAEGRLFHWIIRLIVFVVLWAVTYGVTWLVQNLYAYIWYLICGFGAVAVVSAIIRRCIEFSSKLKNRRQDEHAR